MLPTDKVSDILVNTYINETHSTSKFVMGVTKNTLDQIPVEAVELRGYKYQHLYITTDDEIKEGDWYIHCDIHIKLCTKTAKGNGTTIADGVTSSIKDIPDEMFYDVIDCKKIIATTEPKLHSTRLKDCPINPEDNMVSVRGVSKPSKEFIEEYCKVGGIDEVDVEYGLFHDGNFKDDDETHAFKAIRKPKVTSNNEIIIHSIEEKMKTREQAEQRALELFPIHEEFDFDRLKPLRNAYLQGWEEAQDNQLREAAEKVVYEWHNSVGEECIDAAMVELVKVLNSKKH
jgi:hypothetical protein